MSEKIHEVSRTNLGCRVVRTEDETGEHVVLSVPPLGTLTRVTLHEDETTDAVEFFAAEQCPSDATFR